MSLLPPASTLGRVRALALPLVLALLLAQVPVSSHAAPATGTAQAIAAEACAAFDAGEFERAVDLYLAAYRADPAQVGMIYAAARAAHLAGQLDRADELYRQALQNPGLASDLAEQARQHLADLAARRDQADKHRAKAGTGDPPPVDSPEPARADAMATWIALGGGVALLAAGLGTVRWAWSDERDLNAKLDNRSAGKITSINYTDAQSAHSSINLRYGLGWTATGLGAAAAGVGAWLALRGSDSRVAVLPGGPGSLVVALRF
ncbi:MAG: hypothetical protein HY902_01490 [Deltaproteobacteria bacterium]|nr:hypothetical protein [Deltaproteobacteria bacterium]